MRHGRYPQKQREHHSASTPTTRVTRHRRALRLSVIAVVAGAMCVLAGNAYGIDLVDAYQHASGTAMPTYDRSGGSTPTYEVAQSTWDSLNRTSEDLSNDVASDETSAKATSDESDEDDCVKAALWGMVFDAGWDDANSYSFNLGAELNATITRLTGCLMTRAGLPNATATNLSDFLIDSFKTRALEALHTDPTTKAFIDWIAVTAWYSIS